MIHWELARPRTEADRRRFWRMVAGVTGSGVLLLGAFAILTLSVGTSSSFTCDSGECFDVSGEVGPLNAGLSEYVADSGLRGGTAAGALFLVVPFVLFAFQALRTGTAARERRLAALSLAGATRSDLRRLALLEGTRAAVLGTVLAGPAYLLVWLVLGPALPNGAKMLPNPDFDLLLGWLALVLVGGPLGGLLAMQAGRVAAVSPLGLARRRQRPLTGVDVATPIISALLVVVSFQLIEESPVGLILMLIAVIALAISVGPWFILLTGRLAANRGELLNTLAGRRLIADVRSPGRIVGVLLSVGISFGIIAVLVADVMRDEYADDRSFYLAGAGAAAGCAVVAAIVATSALVVGANEQILDNTRATAILVALAASPTFVLQIVRRQMILAAVPITVIGALLGWAVYGWITVQNESSLPWVLAALPSAVLAAALAAVIGALVAARSVRPAILSSSGPENLRTP